MCLANIGKFPESRRPGESGIHYQGRTMEVEGVAIWVDFRPSHLSETYGTGPQ